jgi:general secretion pathway protein G
MATTEIRRKAGLATLALVVLALLAAALFVSSAHVDSISRMRELTLRQDLFVMRGMVAQYTLDKHERPQSLDDLVVAGYLKQVPTDPMSGRNDTWVLEWSDDPKTPGIIGIRSRSIQ